MLHCLSWWDDDEGGVDGLGLKAEGGVNVLPCPRDVGLSDVALTGKKRCHSLVGDVKEGAVASAVEGEEEGVHAVAVVYAAAVEVGDGYAGLLGDCYWRCPMPER